MTHSLRSQNFHGLRRRASRLVVLAALISEAGCSVVSGSLHEALDRPAINPNPRDVLRITVVSKTDANIRLQADYATRSPECEVQKWPGNPKVGHTRHEVFDVPTRAEGAVIEVIVDKYLPGRCEWRFGGMSVGAIVPGASDQGWSGLLAFSRDGSVPDKPIRITCRRFGPEKKLDCYSGINYVRGDVREVIFETHPYQERPPKR